MHKIDSAPYTCHAAMPNMRCMHVGVFLLGGGGGGGALDTALVATYA